MKIKSVFAIPGLAALLTLGGQSTLLGGTLYWDFDNSITGLQAGSGTWDTNPGSGNRNWKVSSAGTGSDISWNQNEDAVFQTSGTSVVTLNTDISVSSITFNGTGYTIAATSPYKLTLTGAGGNITVNADATISAPLAGTVGLTKLGSATLTLSGTNTYTGVTTISNGVLSVATIGNGGSAGNLGQSTNAAANLVFSGGTLRYTGATASTDRAFTITTGQTATFDITTNNLTVSGASANTSGALTKIGGGTLTLSGTNAFTGLTTVTAGTLAYGVTNALSSGAVTVNGGILALSTFSDTVGAVTLSSGSITGSTGVLTGTSYSLTNTGSVSAILAGTGVALTKTGSGTAILTAANTYTGITSINDGTLIVNNTSGSGTGTNTVSVASVAKLYGTGTIGGATTILGTQSSGASANSVGNQTFSSSLKYDTGSIFEWDIDVNGGSETHDQITANSLLGSGAQFKVLLGSGDTFADGFWDTNRNWTATQLFGSANATVSLAGIFSSFATVASTAGQGSFSFTNNGGTGNQLTWTAVPEPTSALAGILLGAGLLRRKRNQRRSA